MSVEMTKSSLSYWVEHQFCNSEEFLLLGWTPAEHKNDGPILIQIGPQGPPGGTFEILHNFVFFRDFLLLLFTRQFTLVFVS